MTIGTWPAVIIGIIVLLAAIQGIFLWLVASRALDRSDDILEWAKSKIKGLEARIANLEDTERKLSRPSASECYEVDVASSPHPRTPSSGVPAAQTFLPPVPPAPPTLEEIYEEAAVALASAGAFVAFAERYRGNGFTLEPSGPPPSPTSGTADRADIYVLQEPGQRLVLPAFNLRRGQGLLTSDAGRAAEARLGWLFDIETGPELRAIEAAVLTPDGWTVQRKGRLSIPL